jgi:hypothetical protein
MAEKLNNFEKFERKKKSNSAMISSQRPTDDWLDALDNLAIGLVAKNTQNLEKQVKICYIVRGCPHTS